MEFPLLSIYLRIPNHQDVSVGSTAWYHRIKKSLFTLLDTMSSFRDILLSPDKLSLCIINAVGNHHAFRIHLSLTFYAPSMISFSSMLDW